MLSDSTATDYDMELMASRSIGDYLIMLRRHRQSVIISGSIVLCMAVLVAMLWPPTYRSTATILIEAQEVPEDMVRSTITSYADQQIQAINQRVMTLDNILAIVKKYQLYTEEELAKIPRTVLAESFQEAVTLKVINAEVTDRSSGKQRNVTTAFTLSYDDRQPRKAQKVSNELVDLYMAENLRNRAERTRSTENFLRQEAEALSQQLAAIEDQLAQFKQRNKDALPESFQFNIQNLRRLQSQIQGLQGDARELRKREMELAGQLAQTSPYAPIVLATGETVMADVDRLKARQSEYRNKAAIYNENHPDIIRLRKEIDTLSAKIGHAGDKDELQRLLIERKADVTELERSYSADHPDLIAKQRLVEQLEIQLALAESGGSQAVPDNPTYVFLNNQLSAVRMDRVGMERASKSLELQIEELNQAVLMAPGVEKEYAQLQRKLQTAQAKFLDINVNLREAELAGTLEKERKGQRFILLEPPELPAEPVSPNRPVLLFLGVIVAGGVALGIMVLLELLDDSVRSVKDLTAATGRAPLAAIIYIQTPGERARARVKMRILVYGGIAVVVIIAALLAVYMFYIRF